MAFCTCVTGPASGYSHEIWSTRTGRNHAIYVLRAVNLRSDDGGFVVAICELNTRYVLERLQW
jgi:hypothetical protein